MCGQKYVPKSHEVVVVGAIPNCDVCKIERSIVQPGPIDAPTMFGSWAHLCEDHWQQVGVYPGQLGLGRGQRLITADQVDRDDLSRYLYMAAPGDVVFCSVCYPLHAKPAKTCPGAFVCVLDWEGNAEGRCEEHAALPFGSTIFDYLASKRDGS